MSSRLRVLLLKSPDDKYQKAFDDACNELQLPCQVDISFTEVLEFSFVNLDALQDKLRNLQRYSGVMITSPRGTSALAQALSSLEESTKATALDQLQSSHIPIFAVGQATALELTSNWNIPCLGTSTGSAEQLSAFLHEQNGLPEAAKEKPMLFITGQTHSDTLPNSFHSRNLELEELIVYKTDVKENVDVPEVDWIGFFSPSGLKAVHNKELQWELMNKAAIGKTTETAMAKLAQERQEEHWKADVVPEKPTPTLLAKAILSFQFDKSASQ